MTPESSLPSRRRSIRGNASLTVLILNGLRVEAHGERVTTEEACEVVASFLPVRVQGEPPPDALSAATAEVRRILLDEWGMDHLSVDHGGDEWFARLVLRAAGVEA